MKWLTAFLVALMLAWGSYWFIGSRALGANATAWLKDLPAQNIPASYSGLQVQGFPNRFDLALSDLAIGDPLALQWRAPFFHLLALSYRPNNLIAVFPPSQQFVTPGQTLTLTSASARASVLFQATTALPLDHMELVVTEGDLLSDQAWAARFEQLRFATRQDFSAENAHQIGLDLIGLQPADSLRRAIDPEKSLPEVVDSLHLDLTLQPDRPIDRNGFADGGPGLLSLSLTSLNLHWGSMLLQAEGTLTRGSDGTAEGKIVVHLQDWRHMQALVSAGGFLDPISLGNLSRALETLEQLSPDKTGLEVPLRFANGRVSIAGLPLFAAPAF